MRPTELFREPTNKNLPGFFTGRAHRFTGNNKRADWSHLPWRSKVNPEGRTEHVINWFHFKKSL